MRVLGLGVLVILALVKGTKAVDCPPPFTCPYEPGNPGITWTEPQAAIIKAKLNYLWDDPIGIVNGFDFNNTNAPTSNTDYLYDPKRILSTVDCNWKEALCRTYWSGKRSGNIAFSEPKAVR